MLSRPKLGESEVDLLRFQSQFLASGVTPAAKLVKRANRRGGDASTTQPPPQDHRDVVTLDSKCRGVALFLLQLSAALCCLCGCSTILHMKELEPRGAICHPRVVWLEPQSQDSFLALYGSPCLVFSRKG